MILTQVSNGIIGKACLERNLEVTFSILSSALFFWAKTHMKLPISLSVSYFQISMFKLYCQEVEGSEFLPYSQAKKLAVTVSRMLAQEKSSVGQRQSAFHSFQQ